MTLLAYIGSQA